jgi:hypothetical protein
MVYTKQGQHVTNIGKEKVTLKIAQVVTAILHEQTKVPIRRIKENRLQEKIRQSYKILKQQH